MGSRPLLETTDRGLYCASGDFYVDPWRPVDRAVVTHAHSDHACGGCGQDLTAPSGGFVLRPPPGQDANIDTLPYGEGVEHQGVNVSFHPAGHILGSSQVRLERGG